MARLHKEFIGYNKKIRLTDVKKDSLKRSRKELRKKMRKWFRENKPKELQPKFGSQGSLPMNTIVNPIPVAAPDGKILYKYDLDDGVYFIEKDGEDNRRAVNTWHDWVYESVDGHTGEPTIRKTTCVRVQFADGHHIDLPIYYKKGDSIELAHKSKGWILADPKKFYEWFNDLKNAQLERLVRYMKGWKDYRELSNNSLILPSGFALTILFANHYCKDDNDDESLLRTVEAVRAELERDFKCLRPTTPKGEDVFEDYSESMRSNFLSALESLERDLRRAKREKNFRVASEILRKNQFGDRFPLGDDRKEEDKANGLKKGLMGASITPKPYGR